MARFIGIVKGAKGEVTRLGHKTSGVRVTANGWNSGATVYGYVDSEDRDVFEVYRTGGSNGGLAPRLIARIVGEQVEHVGLIGHDGNEIDS